jgi:acyl-CoA synthetase (AMP-forming)/AMP-acid ligase II
VAEHNGLTTSDRGFNPLPLWHINAEVVAVLASLVGGASLVLDDGFHRTDFWTLIDRLAVTWINAVPAIISRLVELRPGESVPPRIRFIRSASAPLSATVLAEFELATGINVVESYGMTEAASQICANPIDGVRKGGSVGPAIGVEVRITKKLDAATNATKDRRIGNVEIRGPSVIRSYEASGYEDRFDEQGWLETGDLGYFDDDDYLYLVGRSDDVINRSGEKIFPREIEDVILGVLGVDFAAVMGEADETFGQVPVAYVQLEGVGAATSTNDIASRIDDIEKALAVSVARTRRPARLMIVEQMPTHATGKVQKSLLQADDLRVLFKKELS